MYLGFVFLLVRDRHFGHLLGELPLLRVQRALLLRSGRQVGRQRLGQRLPQTSHFIIATFQNRLLSLGIYEQVMNMEV
jgi:hypothetical protein